LAMLFDALGTAHFECIPEGCPVNKGDYEECRLLGYKNPVRTSQETHYFSTTESSQLMLCRI
jgi:hypothetical protein